MPKYIHFGSKIDPKFKMSVLYKILIILIIVSPSSNRQSPRLTAQHILTHPPENTVETQELLSASA